MIVLRNLTKIYTLAGQRKIVADRINAVFPSGVSVALLGRNGAGKTTLLRMIAGTSDPTSGEILSDGSISFPVGFAGSFHPDMTGAQNTRFVARIYGADTDALMSYVEDFAELGSQFYLPVRSYSSGMRSRLAFGVSMGLKFDTYLIDEITAVGDADFRKKSRAVFLDRMENAGAIFVSHSVRMMRDMCQAGAVLENGVLTYYDDVDEAIDLHMYNMDGPSGAVSADGTARDTPLPEDGLLPAGTSMFYGIGAPQAGLDWVSGILRKSRLCQFQSQQKIHYFDILAGMNVDILKRRMRILRGLSEKLDPDSPQNTNQTLRLMGSISALLAIHASDPDDADRHKAYVDYLLTSRKKQKILCDFTPSYALLDAAGFADMKSLGYARFMFILRDPATRVWAQICERQAAQKRAKTKHREACLKELRALLDSGALATDPEADYARTMSALEQAVPREQILYLFYEELFTQKGVDRVCRFIDVPERPTDPTPTEKGVFDLPAELATELRAALAPQYAAATARFKTALPAAWHPGTPAPVPVPVGANGEDIDDDRT